LLALGGKIAAGGEHLIQHLFEGHGGNPRFDGDGKRLARLAYLAEVGAAQKDYNGLPDRDPAQIIEAG
jgi:hypothetical protein